MNHSSPIDSRLRDNTKNNTALCLKDVSKSFRSGGRRAQALKAVSLTAQKGQITGLVGPDGAGKTTILRLCAGLLKVDSGDILVMGINVGKRPLAVQSVIGYMPQQFGLYEELSVRENLDLYADLQGIPVNERREKYEQLMSMTRLGDFMDRLAGKLSGGMKQKLGLACTLIRSPSLLILDEPTVGVDPVSRRELWSIVSHLVEDENISVFISTTYLDEAERCHRVGVLKQGELLILDDPGKIAGSQQGNTFQVRRFDRKKRKLQRLLSKHQAVMDAVIVGDAVRLIIKADYRPTVELFGLDTENVTLEPVEPRFEDGYVAMLEHEKTQERSSDDLNISEKDSDNVDVGQTVISVDHVGKRFKDFDAVKNVTFGVRKGEVFGLLGANGAGKTTTFRMICGLLPVSEGKLNVAGYDLRKAAAVARSKIGYMSQKFSLYGQLSVIQNLDFFSSVYNLEGKRKKKRIQWALQAFSLKSFARVASEQLPLGFKQRLALACSLMHEPEILFLDEPTSGVDPMARREFWFQINGLAENQVTIMVTTHFMEEAEYCDRVALMMAGEIFAIGTPSEIKTLAAEKTKEPVQTMEDAFIALVAS
jgi:ABC-2 type transport system ATP-binding protein